ncbi:MAG: hypothetical protein J6T10_30320 [Methanobrevibacter sp.]|nr:hypothetical protein [Methanobrevibacter sp.]
MAYWALFFFIAGGLFRRFLGRGVYIKGHKFSRFFKLIILVLACMLMYLVGGSFPKNTTEWLCMAWAVGWMVRYNSHTHGDYFWLDDTKPDEERSWWVGKVLKLIFGKGKYYNFAGNFVGLTLGYLVPAILASITMPHHYFWIAGFTAPIGYTLCELALGRNGSTRYAEYVNGACMFLLFFLNVVV